MNSPETSGLGGRVSRHRLIAGMASGILLWTAFPPLEWSGLAWIALAPLFWLATVPPAGFPTYVAAWAGGLVFWLFALQWVRLCDPSALFGWVLMALVLSLWWPAFLGLARWAVFRLRLPLIVAAPIIWVGIEFGRAYFLSGFPWYYLAHTQYRRLYLIQVADCTGALGISVLIATVNALLVDLLSRPLSQVTRRGTRLRRGQNLRLCLVTVLLGTALCYGAFRVSTAAFRDGPRLALLQSDVPQQRKMKGDPTKTIDEFVALVDRAAGQRDRPDLIVWPETSYPYGFVAIETSIDPGVLERQVRSIAPSSTVERWRESGDLVAEELHLWTDRVAVPMLVGVTLYDHRQGSVEKFNAAILFRPDQTAIDVYRKMHLVPFGEYLPFVDTLPWLALLTPYDRGAVPRLDAGRDPTSVPLGAHSLAVSICFEDTIPQVIVRFFREAKGGRQPDVLINLSNDGWFRGSSELDVHLAIGVFRAIENRVPLARAVNTGLTALVDGNGEIKDSLPQASEGVLSVTVPLDDRESFYTRAGDWLGLSCLAVTIGLVPVGLIRGPRRPNRRK